MANAVIVSAVRTPIGRANKGVLKDVRPDDLAALAVKAAVERVPGLDPSLIEDLMLRLPRRRAGNERGPAGGGADWPARKRRRCDRQSFLRL